MPEAPREVGAVEIADTLTNDGDVLVGLLQSAASFGHASFRKPLQDGHSGLRAKDSRHVTLRTTDSASDRVGAAAQRSSAHR
jgi:hypothetical protein